MQRPAVALLVSLAALLAGVIAVLFVVVLALQTL
jgi:hypothetical protein